MAGPYELHNCDEGVIRYSPEYKAVPWMYELRCKADDGEWFVKEEYVSREEAVMMGRASLGWGHRPAEGKKKRIVDWVVYNHRGEMVGSQIMERMGGGTRTEWLPSPAEDSKEEEE